MPRQTLIIASIAALLGAPRLDAQCADGSPPPCAPRQAAREVPRPIDPNRIAVLPFRITTTDTLLGEGFAELLATEFTGEGVPRSVDMATVLSAWRAAGGGLRTPLPRTRAIGVARGLGAATVTEGSIVGLGRNITVTVTLINVADGSARGVPAQVTVPADSLDSALRQSAAILLASLGGQQRAFIGARYTNSPAAMRAYLAGLAAWRRGWLADARDSLDRAIAMDSSFAQAVFRRYLAGLWGFGTAGYNDLAWHVRDRLAPQERIVLEGVLGSEWPKPRTAEQRLRDRERAANLLPDSPDALYLIGDYWYHYGAATDARDQLSRARDYFLRAVSLDSQATVLRHLVEVGVRLRDTAVLRRIVPRYLRTDDAGTWSGAWLAAASIGDTALLTTLRRRVYATNAPEAIWALGSALMVQIPRRHLDEMLSLWDASITNDQFHNLYRMVRGALLISRGRPSAADSVYAMMPPNVRGNADRFRLAFDLAGGLHNYEIAPVVAALEKNAAVDMANGPEDLCLAAIWHAQHQTAGGPTLSEAQVQRTLCRWALVPLRNVNDTTAARTAALEVADSIVRNSVQSNRGFEAALLARLWEGNGQPARALKAVRYRGPGFALGEAPWTLPYEGRLAAQVGDTAGAVRAFTTWLEITQDAEASIVPRRDSVRAELARLTRRVVP